MKLEAPETTASVEEGSPSYARADLHLVRQLKMARSAHAYVRGSTKSFYQWLEAGDARIPEGPPVWICGDCHLGNLGPLADREGRVAVQIRDLDQTVIGNPAHDLIRLALSLASAARGWELPGVTIARMLEAMIAGYQAALARDFDGKDERQRRPKIIKRLLRQSQARRWRHLAAERLNAVTPIIPLGRKFWALEEAERVEIQGLLAQEDLRRLAADLRGGGPDEQVTLVDAAYWVKGCSSLGRLRYAVMLKVGEGEDAEHCLIDIKEAVRAAAPRSPGQDMPTDDARRVVKGARALSPNLGQRMVAGRLLDRPVVMRELMPQDLKIEMGRLSGDEATALAHYLAAVLGHAHGRQLDGSSRGTWNREFNRAKSSRLDAPTWLWESVVDLLAVHERAYLEHCRRYALDRAC